LRTKEKEPDTEKSGTEKFCTIWGGGKRLKARAVRGRGAPIKESCGNAAVDEKGNGVWDAIALTTNLSKPLRIEK